MFDKSFIPENNTPELSQNPTTFFYYTVCQPVIYFTYYVQPISYSLPQTSLQCDADHLQKIYETLQCLNKQQNNLSFSEKREMCKEMCAHLRELSAESKKILLKQDNTYDLLLAMISNNLETDWIKPKLTDTILDNTSHLLESFSHLFQPTYPLS